MEVTGIILIVISIIMYFVCLFTLGGEQGVGYSCGLITVGVFFIGACLLASADDKSTPKAIDVYKGHTTLKITYEDSIPTDTVVVFKKEYKKD